MREIGYQNNSFQFKEPFKGLFTQGMVCHETYKDDANNWRSPDEVTTEDGKNYFLLNDKSKKIKVGSSESMSKSKRNTIDPQKIIELYGADAVRFFILSDSPPEKDVHGQIKNDIFIKLYEVIFLERENKFYNESRKKI